MSAPITCWFDFASPYAYVARAALGAVAARHGRPVAWRPVLLWAVLKAQNIAPPADSPAKWTYLLNDMARSAAFFGVPYRQPALPVSTHLAARLFHALTARSPALAEPLIDAIFQAFMAEGRPISDPEVLLGITAALGIARADAAEAMNGATGRTALAAAVEEAIAAGVIGSPFIVIDGEAFFGADRLPQIEWRLAAGGFHASPKSPS